MNEEGEKREVGGEKGVGWDSSQRRMNILFLCISVDFWWETREQKKKNWGATSSF